MIYHINRMDDKDNGLISIDEEEACSKTQHPS
jgi:hypothetical protein